MTKLLSELKVGESCVVQKVTATGKLRRRIFDMGVTPGVSISVKKLAPLGDPIEITIRGYELSLRKDEANNVEVEI